MLLLFAEPRWQIPCRATCPACQIFTAPGLSDVFERRDCRGELMKNLTRAARQQVADLKLTTPVNARECSAPDRKHLPGVACIP